MPLDAPTIRSGTTSKRLLVYLGDANGPGGALGLRHDSPGASVAYVRDDETAARPVVLRPPNGERHVPGAFIEVDPALVPGVYRFDVPDAVLAPGATRVVLVFRFPGAITQPVEIDLVAYDAQDPVRLGMGAISPEARIEALRGAFPRLTRRELEEDEATREVD